MSDLNKEKVSAMVDGEVDEQDTAIVDALLNTDSLKQSWASYHLIGDSLRQNLPENVSLDLNRQISAAIASEPTILAPVKPTQNPVLKPLAGFAIAASVAIVAILGIQNNEQAEGGADVQNPSIVQNNVVNPNLLQQVSSGTASEVQLQQARKEAQARLNSYLVNYNEYRTNKGLQGMLPYARTVTYENNR